MFFLKRQLLHTHYLHSISDETQTLDLKEGDRHLHSLISLDYKPFDNLRNKFYLCVCEYVHMITTIINKIQLYIE